MDEERRLLRSALVWKNEWVWANFGPRLLPAADAPPESAPPPTADETAMFKVLNNLRVSQDGAGVPETPSRIYDPSFENPGEYPEENILLDIGRIMAAPVKGQGPAVRQPLVPAPVHRSKAPVSILSDKAAAAAAPAAQPDNLLKRRPAEPPIDSSPKRQRPEEPAPQSHPEPVALVEKSTTVDKPLPPAKHQKVNEPPPAPPKSPTPTPPPAPSPALPPADPEPVEIPETPEPPPIEPEVAPDWSANDDDDLPQQYEEFQPAPATVRPPQPARPEYVRPAYLDTQPDPREEPDDVIELGSEDSDGEQEEPVRPARPTNVPAAAGGKKKSKPKKTLPKIVHIPATAENTPLPAGIIKQVPKKTSLKVDKDMLIRLLEMETAHSRVKPAMLKQSLNALANFSPTFIKEFRSAWDYAVDLALDDAYKRSFQRDEEWSYGVQYESRWLDMAKTVVYVTELPAEPRRANILTMHRLFWAYKKLEILIPEGAVETTLCQLVFSEPHKGQTLFSEPTVRVNFPYRYYNGMMVVQSALHPWQFLVNQASRLIRRMRQDSAPSSKLEAHLKDWNYCGSARLLEWMNCVVLSGWKFFK